ncbi:hypothetical protein GCK32_010233 [Trichostrongylus colubriformis]|uniref:Sushi domain-containing protein n=1 Tax=Trichostrongylus colubriformis TaxID=6319 RepID=A0AAN8F0P7_TRICO
MNLVLLFFILALVVHLSYSQSPECPNSRIPTQLATVTVWTRESNGSLIYRISDEDLTDEGYHRGHVDREDTVVQLARSPGTCTLGPCTLRLSTNVRSDGTIAHQENVIGIPEGFSDLHNDFYCVRRFGDCGAERPVFRFVRGFGSSLAYAYSLDPSASFPGFTREAKILCYGWSDNGSVVHPLLADKSCLAINTIANGKITYSSPPSSTYSIGTTATLVCDPGYLGGGQSAVLCVKSGWYPSSGLGYCVKRNDSFLNAGSAKAVSSASLECAALGAIPDGQLIYSTLAIGGRFLQGTHVTVACNIGSHVFGSIDALCVGGRWSRKLGICQSNIDPKCPSLTVKFPGRVVYNSLAPYMPSATAILTCDLDLAVSGVSTLTCTEDGWSPRGGGRWSRKLGICQSNIDPKCPSLTVKFPGRVVYNSLAPYMPSATAILTCDLDLAVSGVSTLTCTEDGWSPRGGFGECRTFPRKKRQAGQTGPSCPPVNVPGGTTMYMQANNAVPYSAGTTVFLMCNVSYTPQGSLSALCQNGSWTPPLGLSGLGNSLGNSVLTCTNPTVANGVVTYSMGSALETTKQPGTVATLLCNLGFTPNGSLTSICRDGIFTPPLGTCNSSLGGGSPFPGTGTGGSSQTCPSLFAPFGGTLTYSNGSSFGPFYSGTTVTLRCNSGFPIGASTSTCTNGQWSPPQLGTCSMDSGTGGSGLTCPPMVEPVGGRLSYSMGGTFGPFQSGTTVTLTCNTGFVSGMVC